MGTVQWENIPAERAEAIERRVGQIVKAEPVTGGLMPGLAAILHTDDGQRWFLKAAPEDNPAYRLYAREMIANAAMPYGTPAPRMRHASCDGGWVVMLFSFLADALDADLSPGSPDLPRVLALLRAISAAPAWDKTPPAAEHVEALQAKAAKMLAKLPSGEPRDMYAAAVDNFHVEQITGGRLVHYDLHPGNLKITSEDEALAVDWSFACQGAQWLDAVLLVPRLIMAGHAPGDAEALLSGLPAWQSAPGDAVTGLAALWTMFREYKALHGPAEARQARARAAEAGQEWVRYRMDTRARR